MALTGLMIYVERKPAGPLSSFVQTLWYTQGADTSHRHERILPSGCAQVIWSLSRDFLLECQENGSEQRTAPALIVGPHSTYEIVATSDMADLVGVLFVPGALPGLAGERADLFSNHSVALDQVCGGWEDVLRGHLREVTTPMERLLMLENWLVANLLPRFEKTRFSMHPAVNFALRQFGQSSPITSVAEMARRTGWSERYFSQIFREQVGFGPKTWGRIQRFQRALRQLRTGANIPLAQLAADCSFYDQAHFANEFRSFSGIDVTTYTATRHELWTNHTRTQ